LLRKIDIKKLSWKYDYVFVITNLNRGGAEGFLERLIRSSSVLNKNNCLIISLIDIGSVGDLLILKGYQVLALNMNSVMNIPRVFLLLWRIFRRVQPKVVHTWLYHADALGGVAAKLAGVKTIFWGVRSYDIKKGGNSMTIFLRKFNALISSWVPNNILYPAVSAKELHVKHGYCDEKSKVIPNGYDLKRIPGYHLSTNFRQDYNIQCGTRIVLSIGRNSPEKDYDTYFKVIEKVLSSENNLIFVLAGDGIDTFSLEEYLNRLNTNHRERILLLGRRNDIYQLLIASDIFCLHSKTEAFPNALAEAMLVGRASVVTDVGDAKYLQSGSGFCVPSENSDLLTQALKDLLNLPVDEINKMQNDASERIKSHFGLSEVSTQYDNLYRNL